MTKTPDNLKHGGINAKNIFAENVSGGDMHVAYTKITAASADYDEIFKQLAMAVGFTKGAGKQEALQKVEELKTEVKKGKSADDGVIARIVEGIAAAAPSAVTAIIAAFGNPILGGVAGSITKYVLGRLGTQEGGNSTSVSPTIPV